MNFLLNSKNALRVRLGLETSDQARQALFEQSTSEWFNFKTVKLPDCPYRVDLVPFGPIRRFLGNRRSKGLPLKLKKVVYGADWG